MKTIMYGFQRQEEMVNVKKLVIVTPGLLTLEATYIRFVSCYLNKFSFNRVPFK